MNLHITELEKIKDHISGCCANGCSKIPLFHGTRMYALQVSEKERKRFYDACDRIISFAQKLVWSCPVDEEVLTNYIRTRNPLFLGSVVSQYKTSAYEYGSFYVTTSYPTAITFANNSGGELGQWAYAQCIGLRDFNIDLDAETNEAATIVVNEHQRYESSEKVILVFYGVKFEDLLTERGDPFLLYDENGIPNEEYNAFAIRSLNKAKVTDGTQCVRSYRLERCETYTAYWIRQEDFKKGISIFTEIKDVDKYLKWNDSRCLRALL